MSSYMYGCTAACVYLQLCVWLFITSHPRLCTSSHTRTCLSICPCGCTSVRTCVSIYVCIAMAVYLSVLIAVSTCTHICTSPRTYVHTYLNGCTSLCIRSCSHLQMCMHACDYAPGCVPTSTYVDVNIRMPLCGHMLLPVSLHIWVPIARWVLLLCACQRAVWIAFLTVNAHMFIE